MPRLARIGGAEPAPPLPLLGGSARSTAEYRQLLARLGAWMSFRAAARLIRELFPLASGGCADTVRRRIFAEAARIADRPPAEAGAEPPADPIYLPVATPFVRSCVARGPRHHAVLHGIGAPSNGQRQRHLEGTRQLHTV